MVSNSPAESRILLYSARKSLSAAEKERLYGLLRTPIDWDYLTESATRHGTMPLLFRSLNSLPSSMVPGPQLRDVGRHFVSNAVRSRKLIREMFRILDIFASQGIVGLPYKGPVLSASAYGDPTLRISGDLDILIRREDVPKAMDLLISDGFCFHDKAIGRERFDPRSNYHLELTHHGDRPPVELHWKFSDDLDFPIDPAQWFEALDSQQVAGRRVGVLPPEKTLIGLCLHGTKDLWNRLILVADISEFIRYRPELDWQCLLGLATTPDALRMLSIALLLARDLMEVDLPEDVSRIIDADRVAKNFSERIAGRLIDGRTTVVRPPERIPFALAVRRQPQARVRYLANYLRVLFTPDELDLAFVQIPRNLSFLYYLVRPFRRSLAYLSLFLAKLRKLRLKGPH